MKKLIVIALFGISSVATQAQTSITNTIFGSVEAYFTSFNTNYTFTNTLLECSTGYKQVTGVNAANFIDGQVNLYKGLTLDASVQFSGVGSALNGGEAGIGYNVIQHYDTELNVSLLGGYDNTHKSVKGELGADVVEPGFTVKKKLTSNTFAETGISLPIFTTGKFNNQPTIRIGVGFTY